MVLRRLSRRALAGFLMVVTVGCASVTGELSDAPAGAWELRGRVEWVEPGSVGVRHKSGETVPLVIDDSTVVEDASGHATRLAGGERVTVVVVRREGRQTALRITVFSRGRDR